MRSRGFLLIIQYLPQRASVVTGTDIGAVATPAEGRRRTVDAQMGESTLTALYSVIGDRRYAPSITLYPAPTNPGGKASSTLYGATQHPCGNSSFLHHITNYCWKAHHLCSVSRQPPRRPQPSCSIHSMPSHFGVRRPLETHTIQPSRRIKAATTSEQRPMGTPIGNLTWGTCLHQ